MSDPFVAEIRIFGFNFAPTGWAQCNGQLLPLSQNTALFSLLGTMYGGDGKSTFALPNLEGSVPMFWGQGQGLSLYDQGQIGGTENVTLLISEIPLHNHNWLANNAPATLNAPDNGRSIARSSGGTAYKAGSAPNTQFAFQAVSITGGSLPHNNMQLYLTLNFCIALQGVFPPRG
jgi:microcystin-dependent protein